MTEPDWTIVAADVAELRADLALLSNEVADLNVLVSAAPSFGARPPVFASLTEWVDVYFLPVYRRPVGGEFRWCAAWFEHEEAWERLDALWTAWEALHLDRPTGMATWLTNVLDPQLNVLMGRSGPFAGCTPDRHQA